MTSESDVEWQFQACLTLAQRRQSGEKYVAKRKISAKATVFRPNSQRLFGKKMYSGTTTGTINTNKYAFRLRFNLADAYRIGSETAELELLLLPTGQRVRLRSAVGGTPIKDHPRAAVLAEGFASEQEASATAEKAKSALLQWAIEQRVGIDFGDGASEQRNRG